MMAQNIGPSPVFPFMWRLVFALRRNAGDSFFYALVRTLRWSFWQWRSGRRPLFIERLR